MSLAPSKDFSIDLEKDTKSTDGSKEQVVQELVVETIELRGSISKLKISLMSFLGIMILLTIVNVGTSIVTLTVSKKQTTSTVIDEVGHMKLASNDHTTMISTVGRGESFNINLKKKHMIDTTTSYACISMKDAAEIWRTTKEGITTNLLLLSDERNGTSNEDSIEVGVGLAFDGAYHNSTHACLSNKYGIPAICINFVPTNLCANEKGDTAVDNDGIIDHHANRMLFHSLINPEEGGIGGEDRRLNTDLDLMMQIMAVLLKGIYDGMEETGRNV